jgi:putative ABC transport system substrate-binding protein
MALLAQASRDGSDAIMVLDSPDALANRALIAELIGEARIPALYPFSEFVDAGGLMPYSFDLTSGWPTTSTPSCAAPILGTIKFHLKTAKALGLAVPATLLASADKVIEKTVHFRLWPHATLVGRLLPKAQG